MITVDLCKLSANSSRYSRHMGAWRRFWLGKQKNCRRIGSNK